MNKNHAPSFNTNPEPENSSHEHTADVIHVDFANKERITPSNEKETPSVEDRLKTAVRRVKTIAELSDQLLNGNTTVTKLGTEIIRSNFANRKTNTALPEAAPTTAESVTQPEETKSETITLTAEELDKRIEKGVEAALKKMGHALVAHEQPTASATSESSVDMGDYRKGSTLIETSDYGDIINPSETTDKENTKSEGKQTLLQKVANHFNEAADRQEARIKARAEKKAAKLALKAERKAAKLEVKKTKLDMKQEKLQGKMDAAQARIDAYEKIKSEGDPNEIRKLKAQGAIRRGFRNLYSAAQANMEQDRNAKEAHEKYSSDKELEQAIEARKTERNETSDEGSSAEQTSKKPNIFRRGLDRARYNMAQDYVASNQYKIDRSSPAPTAESAPEKADEQPALFGLDGKPSAEALPEKDTVEKNAA